MTDIAAPLAPTTSRSAADVVLSGRVIHGDQRGRELGFPTANVRVPAGAVPRFGVYAGRLDGQPAAVSVGVRPTFGQGLEPLLEAHLLDFQGDLYGHDVRVELLRFVREERAFDGVDELVEQMRADVLRVREILAEDEADAVVRVAAAIEDLRRGRMVVLGRTDGASDLLVAASAVDAAGVNVLARDARGLVSLALPSSRCDRLGLAVQHGAGHPAGAAPFTVSIEARHGVTTGISAEDRAVTIAAATAPGATAHDVVVPGHVFPLRAADGGVLERVGHPEAATDLVRLAAMGPGAVLCTLLDEDGEVADRDHVGEYAVRNALRTVAVDDVVAYRRAPGHEGGGGPVDLGAARAVSLSARGVTHLAFVQGDVDGHRGVPVRTVAAGESGAVADLADALSALALEGWGVVLHVHRPAGPAGADPAVRAGLVAGLLADLGVRGVRTAGARPLMEAVDRELATSAAGRDAGR